MRTLKVLMYTVCVGLISQVTFAKDVLIVGKNARAFHAELNGKTVVLDDEIGDDVRVTPLARDNVLMESMLGMPRGTLSNHFIVRQSTGIRNGFAVIWNGERYIVYDPIFYMQGREGAGRVLMLGHEIGHHICKHTVANNIEPWKRELEADAVSGSIIARMERDDAWGQISLGAAIEFANNIYAEGGTPTHPPRAARIEAILDGYRNGSSCNSR